MSNDNSIMNRVAGKEPVIEFTDTPGLQGRNLLPGCGRRAVNTISAGTCVTNTERKYGRSVEPDLLQLRS
jgi:hypothetical protein